MFLKALVQCLLLLLIGGCVSMRIWDFEIVSADCYSSDESKLNLSVWVHQISRGEISVSAVLDWKFDADETTMIEGQSFSCYSGHENDYKLLPYRIQKMKLFDFLKSFYNTIVFKNVGKCSNFPDYKAGFEPPLPQNRYKLDECMFTGEGLPEVLPQGYYKIVFKYSGQVDGNLKLVFKVMNKNLFDI